MGISRFKMWDAEAMAIAVNSDIVWVNGDNFSVQFISASDTRAGTMYIDGTNDGPDHDGARSWTSLANFAVITATLLNRLEAVIDTPTSGIRLRWEPTSGVGTMKANVCVKLEAEG